MDRLISIGRVFFALAFIGLGAEHIVFREFVVGRAPEWPTSLPGGVIWAYLTGVAFIAMSLAVLARKEARAALVLGGALIFSWALLRHVPVVAGDAFLGPTWTGAGKALTFFGGAFAVAGIAFVLAGSSVRAAARDQRTGTSAAAP